MNIGLLLVIIVVIGWPIYAYNNLVKLQYLLKEAWSGIDVQLSYRHNLIPNLAETVKGYAGHEKQLFEELARLRNQCTSSDRIKDRSSNENSLTESLKSLFAIAESYPDLKANQNFLDLQHQLVTIEDNIQMARRYYNGSVRNLNTYIESFPSNIIASLFGFKSEEYFDLKSTLEKEVPTLNLS